MSVPTAILASLTFAARNGILMRSGRGLEQLAKVDTIVFDKTGTFTQGKAGVVGIYTDQTELTAMQVLQYAATAEQGLTHPVAEAITRHAASRVWNSRNVRHGSSTWARAWLPPSTGARFTLAATA